MGGFTFGFNSNFISKLAQVFAHLFTNLTKTVNGTRYLVNQGRDGVDAVMHTGQGAYFNGVDNYIDTGFVPDLSQPLTILWSQEATTTSSLNGCFDGNRVYFSIQNQQVSVAIGGAETFIPTSLTYGRIYQCALVHTPNKNAKLYIDNVLISDLIPSGTQQFTQSIYLGARNLNGSPSVYITGKESGFYAVKKALTAQEIAQHYNNPEKTLYWDNGVLKSDILDQATIDSMQAGNGFWYPLTENVSAGGYYRNHALPMPVSILPSETPDVIEASWTDNLDGSFTCVGGAGRDLQWLGDVNPDLPYVIELEIFNYSSGTLAMWDSSGVKIGSKDGFYRVSTGYSYPDRYLTLYSLNGGFLGSIRNIKVYPLASSGLTPLTNWTATTSTNAKQLTTGYQCALQELDPFGLPIGKPDGLLHGDGRGYIDLQDQVISGDFELDIFYEADDSGEQGVRRVIFGNVVGSSLDRFNLITVNGSSYFDLGTAGLNTGHGANLDGVTTLRRVGNTFTAYLNGVEVRSGVYDLVENAVISNLLAFDSLDSGSIRKYPISNLQITKGTRTDEQRTADVAKLMTKYGVTA